MEWQSKTLFLMGDSSKQTLLKQSSAHLFGGRKELCVSFNYGLTNNKIARHTVHIIVSWPNLTLWIMIHISDLINIIRWYLDILKIIKKSVS